MKIPCKRCGMCCRHIAIEIDKPKTKEDRDAIEWYLLHENVKVFIDHDGDWFVEFATKCKALSNGNHCKVYKNRPGICQDYNPEECVQGNPCAAEKVVFNTREEFLNYLA